MKSTGAGPSTEQLYSEFWLEEYSTSERRPGDERGKKRGYSVNHVDMLRPRDERGKKGGGVPCESCGYAKT